MMNSSMWLGMARKLTLTKVPRCTCVKQSARQFHVSPSLEMRIFEKIRSNRAVSSNVANTKCVLDVQLTGVRSFMKIPQKKKKGKAKIILPKDEMDKVISVDDMHANMTQIIEELKMDYLKNLTVRTAAGAIETLTVEFEEEEYKLNEIAQIQRKSAHLIVINVAAFPTVRDNA